ncbi:hypothetical protein ASD45_12890 [Pseudolabrys sp. Root1462]|nr:hypothetical protein ASD45_12890 [Pseudolabrys sp. Root1462]
MFACSCGVADESVDDSGIEMIPEVWLTRGADLYMVENVIKRSESLSDSLDLDSRCCCKLGYQGSELLSRFKGDE